MQTGLELRELVPLAPLTTLGVGGPARYFATVTSVAGVAAAAGFAHSRGLPLLLLGGGSNLVISDEGFPGLVLQLRLGGREVHEAAGHALVRVGAGESWDALVAWTVERGLAGLECLSGIPGSVGATPVQNVGAYGQEVSETISAVEVCDLATGSTSVMTGAECGFTYRHSRFKTVPAHAIVSVTFRLRLDARPTLRYAELQRSLAGSGAPTLAAVRAAVLSLRKRKSMVLDPLDSDSRSVGSFFTNPIVPTALHASLGADAPGFPTAEGMVKVPAAWLIEQAGFERGYARGAVALSRNHTLAIVNRGGATAAAVITLAREVRAGVHARFGITLEPEPTLVGLAL